MSDEKKEEIEPEVKQPETVIRLVSELLEDGQFRVYHMEKEGTELPPQALYVNLLGMATRTVDTLKETFSPGYSREVAIALKTILEQLNPPENTPDTSDTPVTDTE